MMTIYENFLRENFDNDDIEEFSDSDIEDLITDEDGNEYSAEDIQELAVIIEQLLIEVSVSPFFNIAKEKDDMNLKTRIKTIAVARKLLMKHENILDKIKANKKWYNSLTDEERNKYFKRHMARHIIGLDKRTALALGGSALAGAALGATGLGPAAIPVGAGIGVAHNMTKDRPSLFDPGNNSTSFKNAAPDANKAKGNKIFDTSIKYYEGVIKKLKDKIKQLQKESSKNEGYDRFLESVNFI